MLEAARELASSPDYWKVQYKGSGKHRKAVSAKLDINKIKQEALQYRDWDYVSNFILHRHVHAIRLFYFLCEDQTRQDCFAHHIDGQIELLDDEILIALQKGVDRNMQRFFWSDNDNNCKYQTIDLEDIDFTHYMPDEIKRLLNPAQMTLFEA